MNIAEIFKCKMYIQSCNVIYYYIIIINVLLSEFLYRSSPKINMHWKRTARRVESFVKMPAFFQPAGSQACRLTGSPDIDFILIIFTDKQLKKSL